MVQDRARMPDQQKLVHGLPNGAIFSDLERPQTNISRSGCYLLLNISEMPKVTVSDHSYYGWRIGNRTQTFE